MREELKGPKVEQVAVAIVLDEVDGERSLEYIY